MGSVCRDGSNRISSLSKKTGAGKGSIISAMISATFSGLCLMLYSSSLDDSSKLMLTGLTSRSSFIKFRISCLHESSQLTSMIRRWYCDSIDCKADFSLLRISVISNRLSAVCG